MSRTARATEIGGLIDRAWNRAEALALRAVQAAERGDEVSAGKLAERAASHAADVLMLVEDYRRRWPAGARVRRGTVLRGRIDAATWRGWWLRGAVDDEQAERTHWEQWLTAKREE